MGNCCGYCCGSCCDGLRKLARRIKPKVHPTSDPVEESTKEDLGKKASWPNTSRVAPEPCGGDALEEDMDPIKGDSAGGTPLAMVTPSTTSESDVTDDGAVWSWLYQRITEEEGLPLAKGTGASGECDALEEDMDPIKGDSAGGTPLAMGTGASGECDALEEDMDPIKGDSAGGTPLAMVTPSTTTSESDVTDDGAVWSWLYQRITEEEGLPLAKGTGASGECDALEEDMDPIKGDSAGGTPLAMGTGASGECDQAMTMPTVVRKEDDFAGCEDSDP